MLTTSSTDTSGINEISPAIEKEEKQHHLDIPKNIVKLGTVHICEHK